MPFPAVLALFEKYLVLEGPCPESEALQRWGALNLLEAALHPLAASWAGVPWHCCICSMLPCSDREQLSWGCSCSFLGLCGAHVLCQPQLRARLCSPASCQSRCTLLMKVFQRVWFYLWLSSKHPAVKKSCTHGLGCLTLGLPFKFKLLWLIPLAYYFQCKKCESQQ